MKFDIHPCTSPGTVERKATKPFTYIRGLPIGSDLTHPDEYVDMHVIGGVREFEKRFADDI